MKYYAVRKGRKPGIYTSWPECQQMISGFSGSEYKSFSSLKDAEAFMNSDSAKQLDAFSETPSSTANNFVAWVDGSFNQNTGEYGSGIVLVTPEGNHEGNFKGAVPDFVSARNVAGEILAAVYAIEGAMKLGLPHLTIVHDYVGIRNWATGDWKANSPIARYYIEYLKGIKGRIKLDFVKVDAHTGVELNERADALAKSAVGLQ